MRLTSEGNILGERDVVEDSIESIDTNSIRCYRPSESRIEQDVGSEIGETTLIDDG